MRAPERRRPLRRHVDSPGLGASAAGQGTFKGRGGWVALALVLLVGAAGLAWQQRAASDGETLAPARPIAIAPAATSAGTASAAAGAAPGRAGSLSAMQRDLAAAINAARNEAGLTMLTMDKRLTAAATGHSEDLLAHEACSHEGSDGSNLQSRLSAAGAPASDYAETVACGSGSAQEAVQQWLASEVHRPIILGPTYRRLGVGVAVSADGGDTRWTADVGTP